jgi:hypothetical protein
LFDGHVREISREVDEGWHRDVPGKLAEVEIDNCVTE